MSMVARALGRNKLRQKGLAEAMRVKKWKILRGDEVEIQRGKDKGKRGIVVAVDKKKNRLLVEGRNLVKKTVKSTEDQKGGIFSKEAPIPYNAVLPVDPSTGNAVRIGFLRVPTISTKGDNGNDSLKSESSYRKPGKYHSIRVIRGTDREFPRPENLLLKRPTPRENETPEDLEKRAKEPKKMADEYTTKPTDVLKETRLPLANAFEIDESIDISAIEKILKKL